MEAFGESMGFPLYKEWMCEVNKVGDVHVKGVKDFVKYAKRNLKSEEISCPCVRCRNGKCLKWTEVELHLIKWGMQQDYMFWKFHGEREFPYIPEQLPEKEPIQVENEMISSQDSSSSTTLDGDTLTTLHGKNKRGRTRGAGPVSRTKLKTILPIRSKIEKAVKQSNVQMAQDIHEIKNSLNLLLKAYFEGQKFPPQQFPSQLPGSSLCPSLQATQFPIPASSSSCNIFSLSNTKKIATGVIVLTATSGTVVHGHVLTDYERKVQVIDVVRGEEGQSLYLESQGCATTIKETEGGWVFWPKWLLR